MLFDLYGDLLGGLISPARRNVGQEKTRDLANARVPGLRRVAECLCEGREVSVGFELEPFDGATVAINLLSAARSDEDRQDEGQ